MAETTQIMFEHRELVELMLKHEGITEGIWQLQASLGFGGSNIGTNPNELNPAGFVVIQKLGISRTTEVSNLSVDASKLGTRKSLNQQAGASGKAASARKQTI